jgi:cardiolipin synthase
MDAAFFASISDLARELPPATLSALCVALDAQKGPPDWSKLVGLGATQASRDKIAKLEILGAPPSGPEARALAFAIRAVGFALTRSDFESRVEIAWTGRATDVVPLRRVDQVMYEIFESAATELLVVSYAAYRAERALQALRAASNRGVTVTMVLEVAEKNGGTLPFDGIQSIRKNIPNAKMYYWPREHRPQNAAQTYGSMHVKCLVADRRIAFVSSANLTDNALDLNMELGLLVYGEVPRQLAEHFEQLIFRGELSPTA